MGETRRIKKGGWYGNRPKDPKKGFSEEDLWRIPGRRSPNRTVKSRSPVKSVRFEIPANSVKPVNSPNSAAVVVVGRLMFSSIAGGTIPTVTTEH